MQSNEKETVLVIAAHPDDEVLGCGGTIARRAAAGDQVHIAILGEGITSRSDRREAAERATIERLHACSQTAGDLLGATHVSLHQLPDNRFDTVAMLDVVKVIERLIDEVRPSVVYTQHGGDLNIDHVVTYRATLTATRPMADCPVRAVYAYEVASSTEWSFSQFSPPFRPQLFVDIAGTLDTKIEAMEAYTCEARPFPHPRSPESLRAIARRWGTTVGLEAAEAFHVVREIR